MLELAILGLLKERSMHGYQLSKRLTDTLGGFWRVSYGSLYPTLRRLERDAALERVFDERLLEEAGAESSSEDNRFRVRLAFFKYLAPDTRIRLLERRRAYLEERLSTITASLAATRERFDTYTLSLMQHGRESTEQDIAWLNGLIAAERRQSDSMRDGTRRRKARALRRKERTI